MGPDDKEFTDTEAKLQDALKRRAEYVRQGAEIPEMQTPEFKSLMSKVDAGAEALLLKIDNGSAEFTAAEGAALRTMLQAADVTNYEDIAKLPSDKRIAAYAYLASIEQNDTTRSQIMQDLSNVAETGIASMTAADMMTQKQTKSTQTRLAFDTVRLMRAGRIDLAKELRAAKKANDDEYAEAIDYGIEFNKNTQAMFIDEEGEVTGDMDTVRKFSNTIPDYLARISQYSDNPKAVAMLTERMNEGVSMAAAVLMEEGDSSVWDGIINFFNPAADGQTGDFDLSRVMVDDPQRPTKLYYLSPDDKGAQGTPVELSEILSETNKPLVDAITAAGVANTNRMTAK
jgi:hypothetical protein